MGICCIILWGVLLRWKFRIGKEHTFFLLSIPNLEMLLGNEKKTCSWRSGRTLQILSRLMGILPIFMRTTGGFLISEIRTTDWLQSWLFGNTGRPYSQVRSHSICRGWQTNSSKRTVANTYGQSGNKAVRLGQRARRCTIKAFRISKW